MSMLGMQGMYMMVNRYLNVKSKILTFLFWGFFSAFGIWLAAGILYNFLAKEEIHKNIDTLQIELEYIASSQNNKLHNVELTNRKALIAKSITGEFTDEHHTPQAVKNSYYEYFDTHGWSIKEDRNYPRFHMKAQNIDYIVTVEQVSDGNDKWRIIVGNNNFFERNNL